MASGQLAGGLAWLAVSGEDAPDLMTSAPVSARMIMGAKIEAVLGSVLIIVLPLLAALALASLKLAAITAAGIVVSACSATMIQIWFRAQAKRSDFRRRQTSSRLATLAEALSSIFWASAAALIAAAFFTNAAATAFLAVLTLVCAWAVRPRRTADA
jgi:ABC-2 type transport system permease protein